MRNVRDTADKSNRMPNTHTHAHTAEYVGYLHNKQTCNQSNRFFFARRKKKEKYLVLMEFFFEETAR